jgi:CRISPR-associated protein Cmr4
MYKQAKVMFLYAESPVHLGSGSSVGVVDLPIQRESFTRLPMGQASGVKGALREWFESHTELGKKQAKIDLVFGPDADSADKHAGAVAFGDAKIVLFPVRSYQGVFAWVTCPLVLNRLRRDVSDLEGLESFPAPQEVPSGRALVGADSALLLKDQGGQPVIILEENRFDVDSIDNSPAPWLAKYALLATDEMRYWRDNLQDKLVVLNDDDFTQFVEQNTQIIPRVKLGDGKSSDTEKGGNLFYEENLPPETLLYSMVYGTDPLGQPVNGMETVTDILDFVGQVDGKRIQIGGDETIGRGLMAVRLL